MSFSILYGVSKTKVFELKSFRNSWGTAPVIWGMLGTDYLNRQYWADSAGGTEDLWNLARTPSVPLALRIVHAITFDYAIVPRGDLQEAADACDIVHEMAMKRDAEKISHWGAIAASYREFASDSYSPRLGYGLTCTSVSDIWSEYDQKRGKGYAPFDAILYAKGCDTAKTQSPALGSDV